MPLTDQQIRALRPDPAKTLKVFDSGGLYLEMTPSGSKRWRFKYRFEGKEKLISLGLYPLVSLKESRHQRDDAKRLLMNGLDPSAQRKAAREVAETSAKNSLESVAREWLAQNSHKWAPSHIKTITLRLQKDVFPHIGMRPIADLIAPEILTVLRRIESRDAYETTHRVKTNLSQIFRYGVATGRVKSDPTTDLRGALRPVKPTHLAAVTDPTRFGQILRMMDSYKGGIVAQSALSLAPLVFVRPGELRHAEWKDIDLNAAEWRFIASKTNTSHIVPLSQQALQILRNIHPITGTGRYVFPNPRTPDRPMSENTINGALRNLGIPKEEMCGHGLRATARTLLDEALKFPPHLIEHQLAHAVRDSLGRAYNRTSHLPERKEMMQRWADYLDELKEHLNGQ
ncbi:MAG: hypothetical protein RIQ81_1183 [Pseudomonadota bacterium]|jgi:integrase